MQGKTACYGSTKMGEKSGDNILFTRTVDNKLFSFVISAVLFTTEKYIALFVNVNIVCK